MKEIVGAIVMLVIFTMYIHPKFKKAMKKGKIPSDDTYTKYIPIASKGKKKSKGKKGKTFGYKKY